MYPKLISSGYLGGIGMGGKKGMASGKPLFAEYQYGHQGVIAYLLRETLGK